MDIGKGKRGFV